MGRLLGAVIDGVGDSMTHLLFPYDCFLLPKLHARKLRY